jgi:hypothetical protein
MRRADEHHHDKSDYLQVSRLRAARRPGDQQAAQLRDRAADLETRAAHVPQPIGDRLRASAARLRGYAGKHDRTRITMTGSDAG